MLFKERRWITLVLHVIIKNFGRVEYADISLDDIIFFVGNNNSGKTLIMQLIYGIRKKLKDFSVATTGIKIFDSNGQYLIRCDQSWFREVELQINHYLAVNRSQLIKDIFGVSIPTGEIKIVLEDNSTSYFVCSVSTISNRDAEEQKISLDIRQYENGENIKSFSDRIAVQNGTDNTVKEVLKIVWNIILSGKTAMNSEQLFLPASRSGLQMLYRHYFAENAEGNMVMPVKDFMRFLLVFSEDKQLDEQKKSLLDFGEEHLLQGKVIQEGDETFYVNRQDGKTVPLYIASSMIHELTPFIKALSATQQIAWLYCDEVENSLHPLMQSEMARWIIRMVNTGMHVIISSHSDTMASRLNNLFMLTHMNRKKADPGMLNELGLMEADLLGDGVKAGIYEFRNENQDKTVVEKLDFISYPLMGYDFHLFGKNLDRLYNEAERITRE